MIAERLSGVWRGSGHEEARDVFETVVLVRPFGAKRR